MNKDTYCASHNPWKGAGTSLEDCFSYCRQSGLSWPLMVMINMNCACCNEPPTFTSDDRYNVYQISSGKIQLFALYDAVSNFLRNINDKLIAYDN